MWYIHYGLHIPVTQNHEYILKCTKFTGKQANGYMFETNCSSIKQQYNKFGDGKKGGGEWLHMPYVW